MSGRTRILHSDGRFATYRKTLKRRSRGTPRYLLPDWRLTFLFPDDPQFWGVKLGPYPGLIGVVIEPSDFTTVTGKSQDWVLGQARALVRDLSPSWRGRIEARISREAEQGPTESGPLRPRVDKKITLVIGRDETSVVDASSMRKLHERRI